ncbi:MAG: VCBS repeat-containing protein, partial [Gemmataceae bacterium]|nr:VCBS repeat-containing protein [Gemmataceae bacterium]
GLNLDPSKGLPALGDFDGDGKLDLLIPQGNSVKLFKNLGGKFEEVTAKSGDLAKVSGIVTSVAFGDFDNHNKLGIFIGRYRAGNRYLRNNGDGTFSDVSAELGIHDRIYNTSALATGDLNGDGKLDVVMVNENQDTSILFGHKELAGKGLGLTIVPPGRTHGFGTIVKLKNAEGQVVRQAPLQGIARFVVAPASYTIEISGTGIAPVNKAITVSPENLRVFFDPPPAPPKNDPEPKKQ